MPAQSLRPLCILLLLLTGASGPAAGQESLSIYFGTGSAVLKAEDRAGIDAFLYRSGLPLNAPVEIRGYADTTGAAAFNKKLSERRAREIDRYLRGLGVDNSSITQVAGLGEADDAATRDLNRRVDIVRRATGRNPPVAALPAQPVQPVQPQAGDSFVLEDVYFYVGSDKFTPASEKGLDALYRYLDVHKTTRIRLEGHICCAFNKGKRFYEEFYQLGASRARAVYRYLVSRGIDARRLSYRGWGPDRPRVHPELSEADRNRNMRVEVRILGLN